MPKTFGRRFKKSNHPAPESTQEIMTLEHYLEEAELCCEHARLAGRQHRFGAARGLFETAASLYRRALEAAGPSRPSIHEQLQAVEVEMTIYAELARSLARPLQQSR